MIAMASKTERNQKLLNAIKPSSDTALDEEAYKKTAAEVERGVLVWLILGLSREHFLETTHLNASHVEQVFNSAGHKWEFP